MEWLNDPHLGVVGVGALGYGTLAVHQETVPPPLFGQGIFVALGDVAVQLALPATDGLHVLNDREGGVRPKQDSRSWPEDFSQDRLRESSHFEQHSCKLDATWQWEAGAHSIHTEAKWAAKLAVDALSELGWVSHDAKLKKKKKNGQVDMI